MLQELSQEEVANWKRDPQTKKVFGRATVVIADLCDMMIQGVSDYDYTRGFIQGLQYLMNIEGDQKDEGTDES